MPHVLYPPPNMRLQAADVHVRSVRKQASQPLTLEEEELLSEKKVCVHEWAVFCLVSGKRALSTSQSMPNSGH